MAEIKNEELRMKNWGESPAWASPLFDDFLSINRVINTVAHSSSIHFWAAAAFSKCSVLPP